MKKDDLTTVIESAVRAPSVHNTQPWRFVAHHGQSGELDGVEVFADRARSLGVIDPHGRELHVSCGAAIEFARIAARKLGYACTVRLLPDQAAADLLAQIEIGAPEPPTAEEIALEGAFESRYTERDRFVDRPVPNELVEELRQSMAGTGAWLRVLNQPGDEVVTEVLLARADDAERANPEYKHELAAWYRSQAGAADGITESSLPLTPVSARASSFRLRDFNVSERSALVSTPGGDPPVAEHPLVVILGTPDDDPRAWLQAGQALGRLLLRAAAEGVSASPMTQVLEVSSTREMLAHELGLLGHPQMMLRMGYGLGHPQAPRRSVSDVFAG
jgi:nitroreductase